MSNPTLPALPGREHELRAAAKRQRFQVVYSWILTGLLCLLATLVAILATIVLYAVLGQYERLPHAYSLLWLAGMAFWIILAGFVLAYWPFILYFYALKRVSRRQSLSMLIRNCLESGVPLPNAINTYAATCLSLLYRRKLRKFAAALDHGTSLQDAVLRFRGLLPDEMVRFIQLQTSTDDTVRVITEAFAFENERTFIYTFSVTRLTYILVLLSLFCLPFYSIYPCFIGEIFEEIFCEFYGEFGHPTINSTLFCAHFFLDLCQITIRYTYIPFLCVSILSVLIGLGLKLGYYSFRPVCLRWCFWDSDSAALLRYLSVTARRNIPFSQALAIYIHTLGSRFLRKQARSIHDAIEAGTHWVEALAKLKIVRSSELQLLKTAERTGNTDVVLAQLARDKEFRQNRFDDVGSKLVFMFCILLFGVATALYALAIFIPLYSLIHRLC